MSVQLRTPRAVRPTIGFYFRISVEEALRRVVGGRDAISYYEAGMDHTHIDDTEESFRVFQSCVIDEYDSMVDELRPTAKYHMSLVSTAVVFGGDVTAPCLAAGRIHNGKSRRSSRPSSHKTAAAGA